MDRNRFLHEQKRNGILRDSPLPSCGCSLGFHGGKEVDGRRAHGTISKNSKKSKKEAQIEKEVWILNGIQISFSYTNAKERSPLQHNTPSTLRAASQKTIGPLLLLSLAVISHRSPGFTTCLNRTLSMPV